ncbi:MAG: caspase family protein [Chitinophagales bacterium]|nr:caspase family protein [Chitinophagales bacterium]
MSEKTKVFALIVGINKYEGAPLNGCVPDAKKIKTYLESRADLDIPAENILMLLDEAGTKRNIVNAFRKHLSKAGPEDVVLFYFSGHGAQEWADKKIWINEQDDCLETIVCYSETKTDLLADKELRFLIHELAYGSEDTPKSPPHILTIFDCCHSGDNTRSIATRTTENEEMRERRFRQIFPQREWKDFIFAKSIKETDFAMATIKELFPQGPHVQLAAAQDKQPALEIANAGLFTQKLLQVLDASGGKIDYNSLHSLISNYIRFRYKQVPQLAVQGGGTDMLRAGFLNQAVEYDGDFYGKVSYNKSKGWLLNMGKMHGLGVKYPVTIYFDDREEEVFIDKVYASTSELKIDHELKNKFREEGIEMDKEHHYKAKVQAYSSYPVNYYINNQVGSDYDEKLFKAIKERTKNSINVVEVEGEADYTIHFNYDRVFITEAFDPFRPVVEDVKLSDNYWMDRISGKIDNLTRWEFARKLYNDKVSVLKRAPIGIEILQQKGNGMLPVSTDNNRYIIDEVNWEADDEKYRAYIKVRLTNNYKHPLYFCLLVISEDRESSISVDTEEHNGLVEKAIMELQPGQTYEVFQHVHFVIPLAVDEHIIAYNKQYSTLRLKLLISTRDNIAYQHLLTKTLKALDLPKKNIEDWTTELIELRLVNPRYNKVIEQEIQAMLSDPEMAPFATGLYLSTDGKDDNLTLKPELEVIGDEQH